LQGFSNIQLKPLQIYTLPKTRPKNVGEFRGYLFFLALRPQAQGQHPACRGHGWPCLKAKKNK